MSRSTISALDNSPNSPSTKVESIVAILPTRIKDGTFNPLLAEGKTKTSLYVLHLNDEVIKLIVTSNPLLFNTTAGLILLPLKSVKGNGINIVLPFFMKTSPLNRLLNIVPVHRTKNRLRGW